MKNKGLNDEEQEEVRKINEITDEKERQRAILIWEEITGKEFPKVVFGPNLDQIVSESKESVKSCF